VRVFLEGIPLDIKSTIKGPYVLSDDSILTGEVTGDLVVPAGLSLTVRGKVGGDLIAGVGSTVTINGNGSVHGAVVNLGATVQIYGIVGAVLDRDPESPTRLGRGSFVTSR
jgi:hypothetical protein